MTGEGGVADKLELLRKLLGVDDSTIEPGDDDKSLKDQIDLLKKLLGVTDATPAPDPGEETITDKVNDIADSLTGDNGLSAQLYSKTAPSGHIWQLSAKFSANETDIDKINDILGITDSTPSPEPGQQSITEKVDTITEAVTGDNGLSAQLYSRTAPSGHIWLLSSQIVTLDYQMNDEENGAMAEIAKVADVVNDPASGITALNGTIETIERRLRRS